MEKRVPFNLNLKDLVGLSREGKKTHLNDLVKERLISLNPEINSDELERNSEHFGEVLLELASSKLQMMEER